MPVPRSQPDDHVPVDDAAPARWDEIPRPVPFRLAGFGGAGVFLRTVIIPDPSGTDRGKGRGGARGMDVVLVTPVSQDGYLRRTVGDGFLEGLSAFFGRAAADWLPEASLPSFQDPVLGLEMSVVSSTPTRVGLLVRVVEDLDADVAEFDGIDFETSRSALAQAALDVRDLHVGIAAAGGALEPPPDWS